jgi:hypothetical protein
MTVGRSGKWVKSAARGPTGPSVECPRSQYRANSSTWWVTTDHRSLISRSTRREVSHYETRVDEALLEALDGARAWLQITPTATRTGRRRRREWAVERPSEPSNWVPEVA